MIIFNCLDVSGIVKGGQGRTPSHILHRFTQRRSNKAALDLYAAFLAMFTEVAANPVSFELAAFSVSRIWLNRSHASLWPRTLAHSRNVP